MSWLHPTHHSHFTHRPVSPSQSAPVAQGTMPEGSHANANKPKETFFTWDQLVTNHQPGSPGPFNSHEDKFDFKSETEEDPIFLSHNSPAKEKIPFPMEKEDSEPEQAIPKSSKRKGLGRKPHNQVEATYRGNKKDFVKELEDLCEANKIDIAAIKESSDAEYNASAHFVSGSGHVIDVANSRRRKLYYLQKLKIALEGKNIPIPAPDYGLKIGEALKPYVPKKDVGQAKAGRPTTSRAKKISARRQRASEKSTDTTELPNTPIKPEGRSPNPFENRGITARTAGSFDDQGGVLNELAGWVDHGHRNHASMPVPEDDSLVPQPSFFDHRFMPMGTMNSAFSFPQPMPGQNLGGHMLTGWDDLDENPFHYRT